MKKLSQISLVILMVFLSRMVLAGDLSDTSLDKLLALSGLNKQISEIPGLALAGIQQAKQQGAQISDSTLKEMQEPMKNAFHPSKILSAIGNEIRNSISESDAKELLAWYESDLGRVITKAEENASTPAAYQEMMKETQALLADEKSVNIAKRIDILTQAGDMSLQLQEDMGITVFSAISTVMNPGQPINIDAFLTQMSAQKQQLKKNVDQLVILSFVYSYKDIDSEIIEKYIEFLARPNTKKFNDSITKGMDVAFNQSIDTMVKSLAAVFEMGNEKADKADSVEAKGSVAD